MVISVVGKHPLGPPRRTKIPPIRLRSGHALTRHGAMPGVGRRAASAIAFGEGGKRFLTIFFDDHKFGRSFCFEGGKSILAELTFSPTSNTLTIIDHSRVYDFGIHILTFGTFHRIIVIK